MKKIKLVEACLKIGSGATPRGGKNVYCEKGISLIRSQNVLDFDFSENGLVYINEGQASKLNNVEVMEGDVLLNITGDSVARATIMKSDFLPARVNQHVAIIRAKKEIISPLYLLYFLQYQKSYLLQLASAGATRNALTKSMIAGIELELPSLDIQRKIVSILNDIQEKILENKKINENLEQQVLSLYRNKFDNTSNSERKICRADEYFDISIGKTPPRKEQQWFSTNLQDVTWVSISDMGTCGLYIMRSSEQITQEAVERHNVKVVPDNTIILSFKLTVGRIAITNGEMTTNEAIAHFKTDNKEINEYLYCYLKCFNYQTMGSTSSIATAVNSKIIKGMPFVVPTNAELEEFHDFAAPMFAKIKANQIETDNLTELRDTLLPKLMSSELDVSKIEF